MRLDPVVIKQQIENLKLLHPELLEDAEAWLSSLESETELPEILTKCLWQIDDAKALYAGTNERLDKLIERRKRMKQREQSLREFASKLMEAADVSKIELPLGTMSFRRGAAELVGDADPESLEPEFRKVTVTLDKTAIKEALKAGQTVPGFQLSNAPPSFTIRTA